MLGDRAEALARELLPDGWREGAEWVAPSRLGSSRRSLSVRITGAKRGVWGDFSAGIAGDALGLVGHALGLERGPAMAWARSWLGLENGAARHSGRIVAPAQPGRAPAAPEHDEELERRKRKAQALFVAGSPAIIGTPVDLYLAARGLNLRELPRLPRALRFHPDVWNRDRGAGLPCMLACVISPAGEFLAVHRTWLEEREGIWRKADVSRPKMVLGSYSGGIIPLARGASGLPLQAAPQGDVVVLAEGIESSLAAALLAPEWRVAAAVSIGNFLALELPSAISTIVLASDGDLPDSPAALTLQRAAARFAAEGREVRIARWPEGDAADALAAAEVTIA